MTISTCSAAPASWAEADVAATAAAAPPPHSGSEVRRGWALELSADGDCGLESGGWSADVASDELLRTVLCPAQPAAAARHPGSENTGSGGPSVRGTPSRVAELLAAPPNIPCVNNTHTCIGERGENVFSFQSRAFPKRCNKGPKTTKGAQSQTSVPPPLNLYLNYWLSSSSGVEVYEK